MGKFKFPKLDMDSIEDKAQSILFDVAKDAIPEEEVVKAAVDKLVDWLDGQVSYGDGIVAKIVDSYDQVVLRWILGLVIKRVYQELRDADAFS